MPASDARRLSDYIVQVVGLWKESLELVRRIEDCLDPDSNAQPPFLGLTLWSLQKLEESLQISVKLVPERYELGIRIFGARFATGDETVRNQFDDVSLNLQLKIIVPLRLARIDNIEFDCLSLLQHSEDLRVDALGALDALAQRTEYFNAVESGPGNSDKSTVAQKPKKSSKGPPTPIISHWCSKSETSALYSGGASPVSSCTALIGTPWSSHFGPIEPPQQPLPPTPVSPIKNSHSQHLIRPRQPSRTSISQHSHVSHPTESQEQWKQNSERFSSIFETVATVTNSPQLPPLKTGGTFMSFESDPSDSDSDHNESISQSPRLKSSSLSKSGYSLGGRSPTSAHPFGRVTCASCNPTSGGSRQRQRSPAVGKGTGSGPHLEPLNGLTREHPPVGQLNGKTNAEQPIPHESRLDAAGCRHPSACGGDNYMGEHRRRLAKPISNSVKAARHCRRRSSVHQCPRHHPDLCEMTSGVAPCRRSLSVDCQSHIARVANALRTSSDRQLRHPSDDLESSQLSGVTGSKRSALVSHRQRLSIDESPPIAEAQDGNGEQSPDEGYLKQSANGRPQRAHSRTANGQLRVLYDDFRLPPLNGDSQRLTASSESIAKVRAPEGHIAMPSDHYPSNLSNGPSPLTTPLRERVSMTSEYSQGSRTAQEVSQDAQQVTTTRSDAMTKDSGLLFEERKATTTTGGGGGGRCSSVLSDNVSIATRGTTVRSSTGRPRSRSRPRFRLWRNYEMNISEKMVMASPSVAKHDSRTMGTVGSTTTDGTYHGHSEVVGTSDGGAVSLTSEDLFLPNEKNGYAGFCKGAWRLQTKQRKAFRIETRPAGMYSQIEYWRCTKCDFEGSVHNPENHELLLRTAATMEDDCRSRQRQPSPPGPVFARTIPNNGGRLRHHFDQTVYTHPCGIRYRWAFLAKSHICKRGDRWRGTSAKEAYACIFCCIANKAIPPVFEDLDEFVRHIRRHDGNLADGHVEEPCEKALEYTKTIIGRVAGYEEEFDLNIAPRQKGSSGSFRHSDERAYSIRSWRAGSKGSR
ncbi:hypothetical protein KEM54_006939 [Ascosphaera aggregata]|nr:hypothetical protein KEM54_006939 [Ascosphaera aggregata]